MGWSAVDVEGPKGAPICEVSPATPPRVDEGRVSPGLD